VAAAAATLVSALRGAAASCSAAFETASADGASLQQRIRWATVKRSLARPCSPSFPLLGRLGTAVTPLFGAVGVAGSTLPLITQAVASFIKLYLLLLFVRVLLTWFPNVDWMGQPWVTLRQVTDPYLNLFRNLIPPLMGQIDFTPIFGFMVLQFLAQVLGTDDIYAA